MLSFSSADDASVLIKIISKNLKIGLGVTGINKVFPKLIEREPYMGAQSFSHKKVDRIFKEGEAISEIKEDGRYANALVNEGVSMSSRTGEVNNFSNAQFIFDLMSLKHGMVYNGELVLDRVPDRKVANGIINSLNDIMSKVATRSTVESAKSTDKFLKEHGHVYSCIADALNDIRYKVWDALTIEEFDIGFASRPRIERLYTLRDILADANPKMITLVEYRMVYTKAEAMVHFQEALARNLEGTILKLRSAPWKDGQGVKPWFQVKLKLEISIDLKIVGFKYGKVGTKNEHVISTLLVESSCGLLKTEPAGMNEKMMRYVTDNQSQLLGTIVEVKCCGLSFDKDKNYSTLHPSVVELRSDKTDCDSLESAKEIESAAKGLSK